MVAYSDWGFHMQVNRVVAVVTALLGLAAAVAPVAANMDWTSTAGVIVGIGAVAAVALKFLDGWQKHEANVVAVTGRTIDYQPAPVAKPVASPPSSSGTVSSLALKPPSPSFVVAAPPVPDADDGVHQQTEGGVDA